MEDIKVLEVKCGNYWKVVPKILKNNFLNSIDSSSKVSTTQLKTKATMRMIGTLNDTINFQIQNGFVKWESGWSSSYSLDTNTFNYICSYSTFDTKIPIQTLWKALVSEYGGCLTGGQRIRNNKLGSEGCVLNRNKNWSTLFNKDRKEKLDFLLTQFSDTTKTKIHTCPFSVATNGEIAVYVAQESIGKNWFDLTPFLKYKQMTLSGKSEGNEQIWLQAILEDSTQREMLINEFLNH